MTRTHRILIIIAGLWTLSSLTYIVGLSQQRADWRYLGRIPSNPADSSAYISDIEQARQGRVLFANQYTSEAQQPSIFHPLWLVTGWLAAITRISSPVAFHLIRLLAIALFVIVIDSLFMLVFARGRDRLVAWFVLVTSSGVGWMFAGFRFNATTILQAPIDLWVDEANTLRSMSHSAQFIGSQTILLLAILALWQLTSHSRLPLKHFLGPLLALLGFIHPYDLVTIAAVSLAWIFVWVIVQRPPPDELRRCFRQLSWWWLWVVPVGIYYLVGPWQQLAVRGWFIQNINITPTPLALVLGFGLLWPLAGLGAWQTWRTHSRLTWLWVCWIAVVCLIAYAPGLPIQRRLLSGVHIPIAILATSGLLWLVRRGIYRPWQPAVLAVSILFLATTNLKLFQAEFRDIRQPAQSPYPAFVTNDDAQAMARLRQLSQLDEVVLADFWNGNTIAGVVGRPVLFAHSNQTLAGNTRAAEWQRWISGTMTLEERRSWLTIHRITWLYWRTGDGRYDPLADPLWRSAATFGPITLFRLAAP